MSNWEPWLLWIVIAYTVSIALSRLGLYWTISPRRSNAALTRSGSPADLTITPVSPLYSRSS